MTIEEIITQAVKDGKTHILPDNPDIVKFFKETSIENAMLWARKIDNNFKLWKLVLVEREVSFEQIIACAEKYHHSIVWTLALERLDVQEYLLSFPLEQAIVYLEKQDRYQIWEFMLKRQDVQEYLKGFSKTKALEYNRKINVPELEKFFISQNIINDNDIRRFAAVKK